MADGDLDVDALLEESYRKEFNDKRNGSVAKNSRSRSRSPHKDERKERKRSRSRDKDKDKHRDRRDKRRSRSRDRRRRSRSRERVGGLGAGGDRRRSRSRDRHGRRDRSPRRRQSPGRDGRGRGGGGGSPRGFGGGRGLRRSKTRSPSPLLTAEDRDARTIFVMQLSQRVRARDIEDFFSSVGKIKDVKLIMCNKTRRFKGIAYVEYREIESVGLAMGLSGQKLLGIPVIVQPSQAEKNRVGNYTDVRTGRERGPMRLYIGSLHFNITEEMLKGIFEPFGKISQLQLMTDPETGRSRGYGFITYAEAEDAKKALEQMNGFELAGRPMKVGNVTERSDVPIGPAGLDSDELDRAGIDLGTTGRLALMAKLAEGTGMKLPEAANQALNTAAAAASMPAHLASLGAFQYQQQQQLANMQPPVAMQCFMLTNMFDPATESNLGWELEVRDDVIEECNKYGGILHIFVDKLSPQGHVYVKCPSVAVAASAVNALHGRWFAGKVINAAYVPVANYNNLFPDSANASQLLTVRR